METLKDSEWDIVISGTGLAQSLLALSLSRSGKKVLHVDKNPYYGGPNAALSLDEADAWAKEVNNSAKPSSSLADATVFRLDNTQDVDNSGQARKPEKLAASRAYSLALSPSLIFARSRFLSALVSAKADKQLEFLAMGRWWLYERMTTVQDDSDVAAEAVPPAQLLPVPTSREDLFEYPHLDARSKRALVKFLRLVAQYEDNEETWGPHRNESLATFLEAKYRIPRDAQWHIHALATSSCSLEDLTVTEALQRLALHIRSIGVFGTGFAAVLPKYGGLAEVAQIGCRAGAVGGAVYVLGQGVDDVKTESPNRRLALTLSDGDQVHADNVVFGADNIPDKVAQPSLVGAPAVDAGDSLRRAIAIVSSPLPKLFEPQAADSPHPAGAVICISSKSLRPSSSDEGEQGTPDIPIYIVAHSSDTGECPVGQCILYASTLISPTAGSESGVSAAQKATDNLKSAISALLTSLAPSSRVLWSLQYTVRGQPTANSPPQTQSNGGIHVLPFAPVDPVFADGMVDNVRSIWEAVGGSDEDGAEFMVFAPREEAGLGAEDD